MKEVDTNEKQCDNLLQTEATSVISACNIDI